MSVHIVVMGVAGCGKSAVGQRLAAELSLPMIEGDDFHPPVNLLKMQQGFALTDDDRADWLRTLGAQMAAQPQGAVLTCSALKRAYRDTLRAAVPGLAFVHLALTQAQALDRVANRPGHFYPPSLVASQFEALQDPTDEAGVLSLDATLTLDTLLGQARPWALGLRGG